MCAERLLTLKDAYYEEQMRALIDSLLPQVHVLGGGVIGQVAFTHNHQWMHSDTHHQSRNSLASIENFELFQDDSEFYSQFCLGIKTVALISVEPWGVVQFGSTHKNHETKHFVDQVKKLFREVRFSDYEPSLDRLTLDSTTHFSSLLSYGSMEANHSLALPSQSLFPSTSDHRIEPTNHVEDYYLLKPANLFDCFDSQPLANTSSWPSLTSQDLFNTQNLTSSICKAQRPSSGLLSMEDLFQESAFAKSISEPGLLDDDFSRWLLPQPGPNNTTSLTTLLSADPSHSTGLVPLSGLSGNNSPIHTNSIQSSVTDPLRSNPEVKYTWDETLVPVATEKYVGPSKARNSSSLFSKLGLDQLLDSEDQSLSNAAKRRKTDGFPSGQSQVKSEGHFSFDPKTRNIEAGSCIGDSCIMDACNTSSSEIQTEPAKNVKKKAKAGTKPRPKDRQMIQDRLAELRELIPNGEKMSIDRLLERTIRHLNFMQSLIKHAESLKLADKPKRGEVLNNHTSKDGGVTWACEVGDRSMVCPLIVEDLVTPGQMLIEILCEEHGFFLEISDVIRGFGLIILKGVMEVRESKKIWAHFLVQAEGTRRVNRHEIFSSLVQLLQMTGQSADVISPAGGPSSFNNCQPAAAPFPISMADALHCANL
ncbi:transcription factor lhw [Phtheirospermum japonicum]|uniref:Transcription factor lhw n=1 Tax=Phtheirospermum japonicum TaxID=374723 RepID=A0A830BTD0_9LAMI|nr:transcription factor lhw [Phtheirospermum japonicum]